MPRTMGGFSARLIGNHEALWENGKRLIRVAGPSFRMTHSVYQRPIIQTGR